MKMIIPIALLLCSFAVKATTKQTIKCHVSLLGNADTIHFIRTKNKAPLQIADELMGRDILTTLSRNKLKVYKVHQCIDINDTFTEGKARFLEKNLAQ